MTQVPLLIAQWPQHPNLEAWDYGGHSDFLLHGAVCSTVIGDRSLQPHSPDLYITAGWPWINHAAPSASNVWPGEAMNAPQHQTVNLKLCQFYFLGSVHAESSSVDLVLGDITL